MASCGAPDDDEARLLRERDELFAPIPDAPANDLQRRTAELAALSEDEVRAALREQRLSRERLRLLAAAGPPISLSGRVISTQTKEPEVECHISHLGQEVYSDEDGHFTLYGIPSDGQVRIRIKCGGLIERHNLVVPAAERHHDLPAPIELGRGLDPALPSGVAINQDNARAEFNDAVATLDAIQEGPNLKPESALPTQQEAAQLAANAAHAHPDVSTENTHPAADPAPEPVPAPGVPKPSIPIEPEQIVDGSLNAVDIAPELRRRAHALHACYADYLEEHRDARGAVRVRWVIGATGVPEDIEIRQSTFDMPERDECLKRRIARLAFPASDSQTTVNQTFVFSFWLNPQDQIR